MASDIIIYRDFQIVAGWVQVPPNQETDKNRVSVAAALAALSGSAELDLAMGSGHPTGSKFGGQRLLRLAGNPAGQPFATDPVKLLANVGT